MKLIDSHGWTVILVDELFTVTDPLGNTCTAKNVRIIDTEHFVIPHPLLPDEHIYPGHSVPCLGKDFCGNLQKLLCSNATKIRMGIKTCLPDNRILKTQRTRKSSTVPYCG